MKTIYVKQDMFNEAVSYLNNEITFFGFLSHTKAFLKQLLVNPLNADIDDYLKDNGLDRKGLIGALTEKNIIEKETKIEDKNGSDKFIVSYKIPKRNFERKMRRLYSSLFEKNEITEAQQYPQQQQTLLAPNGKRSKLPPKIWNMVRTPQFKQWFGDWEKDPQNASKVIDPETKEPMMVYHGTSNNFDTFDTDETKKRAHTDKNTYFFTDSKEMGATYGNNVMAVFLNFRKPMIVDYEGENWARKTVQMSDGDFQIRQTEKNDVKTKITKLQQELFTVEQELMELSKQGFNTSEDDPFGLFGSNYERITQLENRKEELETEIDNLTFKLSAGGYDETTENWSTDMFAKQAKAKGYDGLICLNISDSGEIGKTHINANDYVAFYPNQIKSINNVGTFNPQSMNINETDCGGAMQGGGSNPEAGQYVSPFGKVQRKKIYVTEEQAEMLKEMGTTDAGNYQYDVPLKFNGGNDPTYNHQNMMAKGFPGKKKKKKQ